MIDCGTFQIAAITLSEGSWFIFSDIEQLYGKGMNEKAQRMEQTGLKRRRMACGHRCLSGAILAAIMKIAKENLSSYVEIWFLRIHRECFFTSGCEVELYQLSNFDCQWICATH